MNNFKSRIPLNNSYLQYPVACNFDTNEIVSISEVTNDNRLKLICPDCRRSFIAVRGHQTPHFRHKPNSSCSGSPETYLHWLAKEIFKQLEEFEIPELFIDDLPEKQRQNFQQKYNKIIDPNVPYTFRSIFKKGLKTNLLESRKLLINKIDVEKEFETELGNIRVDIVATSHHEKVFIEPFFSNQIDEEKKRKLSVINVPTLSLDLLKFINYCGQNYTIQLLKKYLISKKSKKWVYLSDVEFDKHIGDYENYLIAEIDRNKTIINLHQSKLDKISKLELECRERYNELNLIEEKISDLKSDISDLKKELGINY